MAKATVGVTPGWQNCRVYLNGVLLSDVIEVDTEAGYLKRIVRDRDGNMKLDVHAAVTEEVTGLKGLRIEFGQVTGGSNSSSFAAA